MRPLYSLLLWLLLPLVLLRLFWRSRRAPAYRERWRERLGLYDSLPRVVDVWVHAVSVGEVQAAQPLIRHLLRQGRSVLVTTTTPTGARRLQDLLVGHVQHLYTPLDLGWIMRRFLDAVSPRLVLVMETEIWPNMLLACERRGIQVMLVNARLSAGSARGYARVSGFAAETMRRFAWIAAQSADDADRFKALGVDPNRISVTGSIKFDIQLPASILDRAEVMRRAWGNNRPVWVAASTRDGEEELLLYAHEQVRATHPAALLVLVPRHPERFERVAALVQRRGLPLARRSSDQVDDEGAVVYLGDTMGELTVFLAAADVAFVGGSLVPAGGHNLLEPAALGVPVLIGPHNFNFAEITRLLVNSEAAVSVADADELGRWLTRWLGDAAERARVGENGRRAVEQNRGALERLVALVDARLG
ncbi:MAG: 3-deoxy-D-manno-octulosonic acid transferase [Thiohalocapsa sp. PB-PSB1]|nr:MAG: 3-deoxy-D-manno-octulosonic acid transferase [Thiohalocapsa sp. PB-PSB1]HCS88792.1 3-deoxy-D-manno-octulosonic acid transferase [Chromatiaceae bacterium]